MRILVADDLEANRKLLVDMLESWGMDAHSASNGDEAIALLQRCAAEGTPCDIAILDAEMPGLDSISLSRAILADPAISSVRLVMMPALGRRLDEEALREVGVRFQLTKPVRQSQFFDLLATVEDGTGQAVPEIRYEAENGSPSTMKENGDTTPIRPRRILVAEDNTANQKVALRMLKNLGCNADAVANGMEVLDALNQIPYNLLLMDCQMPEMDGYQTATEIRRREGPGKHTTIIAMTAHTMQGDREKCIKAGMDDYIAKPIQEHDLAAILSRWSPLPTRSPLKGKVL